MLLMVASALDDDAGALAGHLAEHGIDVALATPRDLSRRGWRWRIDRPQDARAATGNRVIPADELDGVVGLLPWVSAWELGHIVPEDREYVASEMSAFLLAWLSQLECPVLDRPTASSLTGFGHGPQAWAAAAARAGVCADPRAEDQPATEVTVLGGRAVAPGMPTMLRSAALRVAAAAGRELVTLRFREVSEEPVLIGARPRAAVGTPAVADALLAWLGQR
jgi:hypothetical protein